VERSPAQARSRTQEPKAAVGEKIVFEEELKRYLEISEKNTHYGLLGIAGDCDQQWK
jgi:hypothetical protein